MLTPPELLAALSRHPRAAGSDTERAARDLCACELKERGFRCSEYEFEYSIFPGKIAVPLGGIALIAAAAMLAWGRFTTALMLVLFGAALILSGRRFLTLPFLLRRGVNLEGTRGGVTVWLVAHLDTKSQPATLLLRATGAVASVVLWPLAALVAALATSGRVPYYCVDAVAVAVGAAAVPLALSTVGDDSPGALDNASGVATVVGALDLIASDAPVGVLITSAEELALAGVTSWAAGRAPGMAVNCDGVDDEGDLVVIVSHDPDGMVSRAAAEVAARYGKRERVRIRSSVPGVLFDGVALARAGWSAVTVSKGNVRSLGRVHTSRDDMRHLRGEGLASAAELVAALAGSMIAKKAVEEREPLRA